MAKSDDNKLATGLILMVFGLIFLLDKTNFLNIIPHGNVITDFRVLILIAGVICLFAKKDKMIGAILTGIGILLNADFFFGWCQSFSGILTPVALIIVGIFFVFRGKK